MKKISVIVPVYNMERYLEKCVDSILNSTYTEMECILVNDGSKDNSAKICDAYAEKDARVKVIHKENGGLTSARRAGFEQATGEYICFVDSDDYIAENMLEVLYQKIEAHAADVCTGGHYQDDEGKIIEDTFTYPEVCIEENQIFGEYVLPVIGKIYAPGYKNYPGYVWGRLYRKACITDACFVSEREVYTEDDLFQMYLSKQIKKAVFTNEKLCYYRENSNSLTHVYRKNMWEMLKKRHTLVEEFLKEYPQEDVEERLQGSAYYTVYVSVTNAYNLSGYHAFCKEMRKIREDVFAKEILKRLDTKLLRPRQRMLYELLRCKCYMGIYYMRDLMFR